MTGHFTRWILAPLAALALMTGAASSQMKVKIAIGGAGCLCYLPTMLAERLGEYKKAGVDVELIDFKGGSQALTAIIGGSADVVSGYFDHCVNLAAKNQALEAFVVYDRYPGLALAGRRHRSTPARSARLRISSDKKVGVSAPGSSTDFFLKYLLKPRTASIRTRHRRDRRRPCGATRGGRDGAGLRSTPP